MAKGQRRLSVFFSSYLATSFQHEQIYDKAVSFSTDVRENTALYDVNQLSYMHESTLHPHERLR